MFTEESKERFGRNRKLCFQKTKTNRIQVEEDQLSPEQIVGHCKLKNTPMMSVERIYQFIREDKANEGTLYKNLQQNKP